MGLSVSLSRMVQLTFLALVLAASLTSPADAGSRRNSAPSITGVPAESVAEGSRYVFRPRATDADGDSLFFSIRNRPSWARFSSSSGRLSGTPTTKHIGTYGDIMIRVSDGSSSALLGPFSITVLNSGNTAPTISGPPATRIEAGSFYGFQPVAGDADGDDLTFSIANRPAWARFSRSTGRLTGTPGTGDAGNFRDIRISVSDGIATTSLPAFGISVSSSTRGDGSVSLNWFAPTSRSDGTPIAPSELSGYTVHYGSAPGRYTNSVGIDDPFATTVTLTDLPAGTYYFALTVEDRDGQQSDYSDVVSTQVQ